MEKERIKMEKAGLSKEDIKMLQQSLAAVRSAGIEMGVEDLIRAAKVLGQSGWSMEELEKIRPPATAPDLPKVTVEDLRQAMIDVRKKSRCQHDPAAEDSTMIDLSITGSSLLDHVCRICGQRTSELRIPLPDPEEQLADRMKYMETKRILDLQMIDPRPLGILLKE